MLSFIGLCLSSSASERMQKNKQSIQTVCFEDWIGMHFRVKLRKLKCTQFGPISKMSGPFIIIIICLFI